MRRLGQGAQRALEDEAKQEAEADAHWGAIDLPLYDPKTVRSRTRGGLCLSQVSFKLGVENTLHLTVLYRSHPYIAKALGDFLA